MRHAWIAFALLGCASDALPPPDVALSVGQEKTAWTEKPGVARIKVDLVQLTDGKATPLIDIEPRDLTDVDDSTPPMIIEFPEQHFDRPAIARFVLTALAVDGTTVLRGDSIFYGMTSVYAVRIPMFVGRVQRWARPLSKFGSAHIRPVVHTMYELLITVGGDPVAGQNLAVPEFFDAAVWQMVSGQPPLPRAPKTVTSVGTKLLMLDDAGAEWLDLATDMPDKVANEKLAAITPPLDYSLIAGGEALEQPKGLRYVIGGTHQTALPTDKVLHIGENLAPSILTLSAPRAGAAAVFVGTTLVVVGGSATGAMAEVLRQGETAFAPLPYMPDATAGHGVAALDEKTVLVAGGKDPATGAPAPMRTLDVTCTATCTPVEVGTLPVPLTRTKIFVLAPTQALIAGEADDATMTGVVHVFSIDPSQPPPFVPVEIELKEPRAKATPVMMPNGQVGMVGGHLLDADQTPAKSLEIFISEPSAPAP